MKNWSDKKLISSSRAHIEELERRYQAVKTTREELQGQYATRMGELDQQLSALDDAICYTARDEYED